MCVCALACVCTGTHQKQSTNAAAKAVQVFLPELDERTQSQQVAEEWTTAGYALRVSPERMHRAPAALTSQDMYAERPSRPHAHSPPAYMDTNAYASPNAHMDTQQHSPAAQGHPIDPQQEQQQRPPQGAARHSGSTRRLVRIIIIVLIITIVIMTHTHKQTHTGPTQNVAVA